MTGNKSVPPILPVPARKSRILLPGILLAVLAAPAGAATVTTYQMTGIFDLSFISSMDGSPVDNLYADPEPVSGPTSFTLSFDLDDSVTGRSWPDGRSEYYSAISNLSLNVDGVNWWSAGTSNVSEYISDFMGVEQHQWSFFADPANADVDVSIDSLDLLDVGTATLVSTLSIFSLDLYLIDSDATLFSQNPPELLVFDGTEFESRFLEVLWADGQYQYTLTGDITAVNVSTVPIPGAAWLFSTALLGLGAFIRSRRA